MTPHLTWRDALLALAIVLVWGTNFVVIRLGLNALPPLFYATLRFVFVMVPAILFLPRPKVRLSNLALYGLCIGVVQFGLLFIAMKGQISPALASLVIQTQVFFTIGLSIWRTGEKIKPHQIGALALAVAGMGVIAANTGQGITTAGVALVLLAAMGWAMGNQASREAGQGATGNPERSGGPAGATKQISMLAYVVWAAPFAVPPLLLLSLAMEGPTAIAHGVRHAGLATWCAVLWQSVGNTLFGYTCWAWLLSRYPAATVAPMSLLVPVFGFASSAIILHEQLQLWKIGAMLLIMAGLAVNLLWRPRKAVIRGEAC
jgi:O-acetylserine/cysteine efflux transporter